MYNRIKNKYAFSDIQASKDFTKSVFWSTMLNITVLFPAFFAFAFLKGELREITTGDKNNLLPIYAYIGIALALMIVMYIVSLVQYDSAYTKTYTESAKKRIKLAEKLRKLPIAFFAKKDIADLSSTIMKDATDLEEIFSHAVPQLYASFFSASFIAVAIFAFNYKMALALLWVVPVAFLVFFLTKKLQARLHKKLYLDRREILDKVQEGLELVSEIKAYNYEKIYTSKLNQLLDKYEKTLIKMELSLGLLVNVSYVILKLGLVSVLIFGGVLYGKREISIFTYIIFIIISTSIYQPFIQSLNHMGMLVFLKTRIARMKEMDALPIQEGKSEFNPKDYNIVFENVNFSYDSDKETIKNVSFIAKQGQVTALVGPSGGGKSTISKLAARFWDINSGSIKVGGEDISLIDPETLLKHYSIVFQDVTLFNYSIMENIRIGNKNASDEEVIKAAELAQCGDFIKDMPQGYDTLIGENGAKLSGGERQRISIARAILKNAPIILLDEATASIDAENETKIQAALTELVKNKTVLIIAHRMRTIIHADKILVIKDGELVEEGRPEKLLKEDSLFRKMNNY